METSNATTIQHELDAIMTAYTRDFQNEHANLIQKVDKLFNRLSKPNEKVNLFKYLPSALTMGHCVEALQIEFDSSANLGVSKMLKSTLAQMEFPEISEKKKALLLLHECLRKTDEQQAQDSLIDFLRLCSADDTAPLGYELESLAERAVLNHFRYAMRLGQEPESWQFDTICGLCPVQSLVQKPSKEYRLLHHLLFKVFAEGNCSEYMSFYCQNKELIETKWKLSNEELMNKVRTLALCTLCGEATTVKYSEIVNKLCIGNEDVERFVIEAMSLGLLNAKIDSMAQTVTVKAVHHPLFEHSKWLWLSDRLLGLYNAVSTLVTTLDEVRVQQVKEERDADRLEGAIRGK